MHINEIYKYTKDLHILYVEDDLNLRDSTAELFDTFFKTITLAVDGMDGLEKYLQYKKDTTSHYDIVITDINMPRKDGITLIQDITKINPEQIIIVTSGQSESQKLIDLIQLGIADFITKPTSLTQLKQVFLKVSKNIYNENIKQEFIITQAKLASMGEMLDNVAHQWLGPLNIITMQAQILELEAQREELNKESITNCAQKQVLQINHLTQTLEEFRTFFRPSDKIERTVYSTVINSTLILLQDQLLFNNVKIQLDLKDTAKIDIIPSEFKHVLINIINNAIDEFIKLQTPNPTIKISTYNDEKNIVLEIEDNAGGIEADAIEHIFEANFTTKRESKGTGMGLHIVVLVLEKIHAEISVKNGDTGAKFIITMAVKID